MRVNNLYYKRKSPYYLYVFLLIMWSTRTSWVWDTYSSSNIMTIVYLLINFFFYRKYCRKVRCRSLYILLGVHILWYLFSCLKYQTFYHFPYPYIYNVFTIFIAYNMLKEKFFYLYEQIVVELSIVSLIVWILSLFFPATVLNFFHSISVSPVGGMPMDCNALFTGLSSQFEMGIRRNLGFTWEPGRYSVYLLLALFINLSRNKFDLSHNYNFIILVLSLISTLSTTGYLGASIIFLYYFYNKKNTSRVLMLCILALVLPSILALSFMSDKISENMIGLDYETEIHDTIFSMNTSGMVAIVPQRGLGLWIDIQNAINDIFLGYGNYDFSYGYNHIFPGAMIITSNGLVQVFAIYGIFYAIFLYYMLFKSSILYSELWKVKGRFFFALLFIVVSVSYNFWNYIFMMFVSFYFMKNNGKLKTNHEISR